MQLSTITRMGKSEIKLEKWNSISRRRKWKNSRSYKYFNKKNYGVWEYYELNGNITVNAVYDPIQYKVEFDRLDSELASPELTLVANCIQVIGYEQFKLDYTQISQNVVYDVPQLNQNIVPIIGNSICSPTSTTMLLKYYGHEFNQPGFD